MLLDVDGIEFVPRRFQFEWIVLLCEVGLHAKASLGLSGSDVLEDGFIRS